MSSKNQLSKITTQFVENELYKLCAGSDTRAIIGHYSRNSQWLPQDIIMRVLRACLENTSVEDICSTEEGPSADTVHRRLAELQLLQIERLMNNWLREIVSRLRFNHQTKLTITFDDHTFPYYGETKYEWVTGSKKQKSTHYCVMFTVVSITTGRIRCPIYVYLQTKERRSQTAEMMSLVLDELLLWLPIKRVLLDRWYQQSKVVNVLNDHDLEFVIAGKRHGEIKREWQAALEEIQALATVAGVDSSDMLALGRWARKNHVDSQRIVEVPLNSRGTTVTVVLIFLYHHVQNWDPLKRETYNFVIYLTNIHATPEQITRIYDRRWLIETDMRCIGMFQGISNSRSGHLRMFLFGLAMVLDALWVVATTMQQRIQQMPQMVIDEETIFWIKQHDRIVIIAKAFIRLIRLKILAYSQFPGGDE